MRQRTAHALSRDTILYSRMRAKIPYISSKALRPNRYDGIQAQSGNSVAEQRCPDPSIAENQLCGHCVHKPRYDSVQACISHRTRTDLSPRSSQTEDYSCTPLNTTRHACRSRIQYRLDEIRCGWKYLPEKLDSFGFL